MARAGIVFDVPLLSRGVHSPGLKRADPGQFTRRQGPKEPTARTVPGGNNASRQMTWHLVFIWITRKIPVRRWRTLGWIYVGILLLSGIPVARCLESRIQRMPQWGVLVSLLLPILPLTIAQEVCARREREARRRELKEVLLRSWLGRWRIRGRRVTSGTSPASRRRSRSRARCSGA